MTKKFYMTPGSCSTGIHILLEECGLVFEAHIVNLLAGDQYKKGEYLPRPGDIVIKNGYNHHALVVRTDPETVTDSTDLKNVNLRQFFKNYP